MQKRLLATVLLTLTTTSCVGVRHTGDTHTAHAESFHLLGLTIPRDDRAAAWSRVPDDAEVTTVLSTPNDSTSILGVLNKILGFGQTQISWSDRPSLEGGR